MMTVLLKIPNTFDVVVVYVVSVLKNNDDELLMRRRFMFLRYVHERLVFWLAEHIIYISPHVD